MATLVLLLCLLSPWSQVDESPAGPGEWGFRPAHGATSRRNPPAFCWRPQQDARSYTVQIAANERFDTLSYEARDIPFNVHTPTRVLDPGDWYWRLRAVDDSGGETDWSSVRRFSLDRDSRPFPLPGRPELLSRIPASHPRLFVRPEQRSRLRGQATGERRTDFDRLVKRCDDLLDTPPDSTEPPLYPEGTVRKSEEWRAIWWGNRRATIAVLEPAATLGFVYWIGGDRKHGELGRRLLLDAARWNPLGATGYRYNDEAGMPYAYQFSRAYSFLHHLLTEEERALCREVMTVRGREMYRHLHPRHLWRPYSSHANRAWHFLGEVAIAFHGEIAEADDWLWFAVNVFSSVYPVWSDPDGGWHEGTNYWNSYIGRFTWWADVMHTALELDAYRLPYFSRTGDWAMRLLPPGTVGGGFGDLTARIRSNSIVPLMTTLATQAGNPAWQWYVEQHGEVAESQGYIAYLRASGSRVKPREPDPADGSALFEGTGQAVLNTDFRDAHENVQVIFKSSPFGTQSHGYESQNAFLLYAFGERLLIRSGRRDIYGSEHHQNWMWDTRSVNSIRIGGVSQTKHSAAATGRITRFHTSAVFDHVVGEAASAYPERVSRFRRAITLVKPDLIVIDDLIQTDEPADLEWLLHAPTPFAVQEDGRLCLENGAASCTIQLHQREQFEISQTDRFDPPPRARVELVEHHLTARAKAPLRSRRVVCVIRVTRSGAPKEPAARFDGNLITTRLGGRRLLIDLGAADAEALPGLRLR